MGLSSAMAQAPASQQKPPDATKDAPKAVEQPKAPGQQPPAGQKTALEQFKNIQVLKTVPAEDLLPTMRYISAALGVECNFCHVRNPDFAPEKDDKKEKQTARKMMQMVMTINQENFEGHQDVSCNSCHNGHNRPQTIPPVITEAALKERLEARAAQQQRQGPPGQQPPAGQAQAQQPPQPQGPPRPSAESLFQKYEQAIGGSEAITKITSRYAKGTLSSAFGNQDFEQYNKAPDKAWMSTTTPRGVRVVAWDGAQGWTQAGKVEPMRDVTDVKVNSDFYRNLKFTDRYKGARVFRKEKVGDRDTWVVMVRLPDSPFSDMLYFDAENGLLLRRTTLRRTALGPLPNTADFADYRDVNGVKVPFKITISNPDVIQTLQVSEMKLNVPVEDTRFAMPASTE
jgi:hypothetical protein